MPIRALLERDHSVTYEQSWSFDLRKDQRSRASAPATAILLDGSRRSAAIVEISEGGCRLCGYSFPVSLGEAISLKLGKLGPVHGHVVWHKGDFIGVHFSARLRREMLRYVETYIAENIRHTGPGESRSDMSPVISERTYR